MKKKTYVIIKTIFLIIVALSMLGILYFIGEQSYEYIRVKPPFMSYVVAITGIASSVAFLIVDTVYKIKVVKANKMKNK